MLLTPVLIRKHVRILYADIATLIYITALNSSVVAESVVEAEIEATATEEVETAIGMTEAAEIVKCEILRVGDQTGRSFHLCRESFIFLTLCTIFLPHTFENHTEETQRRKYFS